MNKIDKDIYNLKDILPPDFQGWNGNSTWFENIIRQVYPNTIIEVGSWKGQSAITMANALKNLNLEAIIHCVDTWLGALEFWDHFSDTHERNLLLKNGYPNIYYQFLSNVIHAGVQDYILPFPNTSLIAARYFKNRGIIADLIYIDGSHDYEDVLLDLEAYFPLLRNGGVMFGDDYHNGWTGVINAVNDFANKYSLSIETTPVDSFWVIRK
jgi:predicted O-methyltransferase YrrM